MCVFVYIVLQNNSDPWFCVWIEYCIRCNFLVVLASDGQTHDLEVKTQK